MCQPAKPGKERWRGEPNVNERCQIDSPSGGTRTRDLLITNCPSSLPEQNQEDLGAQQTEHQGLAYKRDQPSHLDSLNLGALA